MKAEMAEERDQLQKNRFKAVIEAEAHLQKPIRHIEVAFKAPVFLPSQQNFSLFEAEKGTGFSLHNSKGNLVLYGSLS